MSLNPIRLQKLFEKYLHNNCTKQELREFWKLLSELSENDVLTEQLELLWQQKDNGFYQAAEEDKKEIFERILEKGKEREIDYTRIHRRPLWPARLAVAAAFAGVVAAGYWLFVKNNDKEAPAAIVRQVQGENDVAPGGNKAVLTLANGKMIILDSAHLGPLASQGNSKVMKVDSGMLAYHQSAVGGKPLAVQYNTLATPRGGQYQLKLPDGSKVWLNAASSIRYPVAFTGQERTVEITGEVYFEIAPNANQPFRVKADGMEVEVLGTHFDINTYSDETTVNTTLLEGRVKVTEGNQSEMLVPGQQAQVDKQGRIRLIKDADIDEAIAWKNGLFYFDNADLPAIMRQLSRWYDVEVIYEGTVSKERFNGQVFRDLSLSQALGVLELSGVHFRIDGKKLTVLP